MAERIITLFGEEIAPEQIKAVGKSRAKKKPEEKKDTPGATEASQSRRSRPLMRIPQ